MDRRKFLAMGGTSAVALAAGWLGTADRVLALQDFAADCGPGSDCTNALQAAIDSVASQGGGVVTIGQGQGALYDLTRPINMRTNVTLTGVGNPVLRSSSSRLVNFERAHRSGVSDLIVRPRTQRESLQLAVFRTWGSNDVSIDNVRFERNGGEGTFIQLDNAGTRIKVTNCEAQQLSRFAWLRTGQLSNVELRNNRATDIGHSGVTISGAHRDLLIEGNTFSRHFMQDNVDTSHMIATDISGSSGPVRNLRIIGNTIEGVPGVAKYRNGSGNWVRNRASGDLVAVRYVHGWELRGNTIRHSGEVGVTISDDARDGEVVGNEITDCDTTALLFGSALPGYARVRDIHADDNEMRRYGLDATNSLPFHALAGVRVWNAADCSLTNSTLIGGTRRTAGLYVIQRSPAVVWNFIHRGNTYGANQLGDAVGGLGSVVGTPIEESDGNPPARTATTQTTTTTTRPEPVATPSSTGGPTAPTQPAPSGVPSTSPLPPGDIPIPGAPGSTAPTGGQPAPGPGTATTVPAASPTTTSASPLDANGSSSTTSQDLITRLQEVLDRASDLH